jgi:anti-sigma regulatory factor (Ser/Thr protein kinase)
LANKGEIQMKLINWYTSSLTFIACAALIYSLMYFNLTDIHLFIVMVIIVIVLELFPISLPSGDQYAAGSIGYLLILVFGGFPDAVLAIYLATLAYFLKRLKHGKVPFIRLFVTIGMYVLSALVALLAWEWSHTISKLFGIFLVAIIFESVNFVILEGLDATVFKRKLFSNLKQKLLELVIPVVVSLIVMGRLVLIQSNTDMVITLVYTFLCLLIIIYFSREYMKQLSLRKSTSKSYIQFLEGKISPNLTGHGNRVGLISDLILDDIGYPKKHHNDLIQASVIHDIGKAVLPTYLFRKRGNLTLSEEREYRTHPEKAMEIVKAMFPKEIFTNGILYHHERWDGNGFPKGLKGEEIPLEARIIALSNEIDHIVSRQNDTQTILKLLNERAGTILDPSLVAKIEPFHIEMILDEIGTISAPQKLTTGNKENVYTEKSTYANLGESFFIQVTNKEVLTGEHKHGLPVDLIQTLANAAIELQRPVQETLDIENRHLVLHAQSFQNGDVTIYAHDLTPYIGYRRQLEQSILESYVEVINTLTNGKIKLHSTKSNLMNELGDLIDEIQIEKNADVPKSRELIKQIIEQYPTVITSMKVQIAVTESVTNTLKHATNGKLTAYKKGTKLQFLISDKGSGIPLHEIPKTILVSGYSSKRSLGQGFKMITNFSDAVQIFTSSEGTSILIEFTKKDINI